jgi:hypothetical protein
MKAGDIFTLDAQAIEEVATFTKVPLVDVQKKVAIGDVYSIAKSETCSGEIIRGSRWVDDKPRKGRPRRFPRATVLRLLGEEDTTPSAEEVAQAAEASNDAALEEEAARLLAEERKAAANSW